MKIAFDVKGTLVGPMQEQVLHMLRLFQKAGCEIVVWSNAYSYATDTVRDLKLNAEAYPKRSKSDYDHDPAYYVDIAVEDDPCQLYLAAKKFVWVDEIPKELDKVEELVNTLLRVKASK